LFDILDHETPRLIRTIKITVRTLFFIIGKKSTNLDVKCFHTLPIEIAIY